MPFLAVHCVQLHPGTANSWILAVTGTVSEFILLLPITDAEPLHFFKLKTIFKTFFILKFHFYIFIYDFLSVAIVIPSRGRAIRVPQNKNWKILPPKIDYESFNAQELFSNLSLT